MVSRKNDYIGRQKPNEKHVTIRQPDTEETPTTNNNNICKMFKKNIRH